MVVLVMVMFLSVEGCRELLGVLETALEDWPVVAGATVNTDVKPAVRTTDLVGVGQIAVGVGAGGKPDVAGLYLVGGYEGSGELVGFEARQRPGQRQGVSDELASPGRVAVPMLVDRVAVVLVDEGVNSSCSHNRTPFLLGVGRSPPRLLLVISCRSAPAG